jgi:L-arabinokinase
LAPDTDSVTDTILPSLFFYISGHGFGHASRQIEIINALGRDRPDLDIVVRTSAPVWLFERTARVPLTVLPGECDTGVVQIDSLRLDERATIQRAAAFHRTLDDRARHEAKLIERHDGRLVISDAPPLACAAAAKAGVPSVVVTNFTWDWIYEGYADELGAAPDLLPAIRSAYRHADAAWRLPMHGGFATFDTIVDLPFVARHATHARDDVRRTLGLPLDRALVLSSFGGYGVNDLDLRQLDCLDAYGVVVTRGAGAPPLPPMPAGVHAIEEALLYGAGLRYEDLVGACDVVATKPGYGIISECIANGAAMLYTSRGHFVEYDVLVTEMPRYLHCGYIDQDDLFAGRWRHALTQIIEAPAPPERPATNGADVVASLIGARKQLA